MKKLIYIIITSCLLLGIGSCDQDIDYPYEGKDRIYFQCFTFNSYTRIRTYRDSLTFSQGQNCHGVYRTLIGYGKDLTCKCSKGFIDSHRGRTLSNHR